MEPVEEFCDLHDACSEGREWAMKNYTSMNDVWKTIRPDWLVWIATRPGVLTDKELRLFAVFCARQVQHLLTDPRSIDAIDVAERFAHGEASAEELAAASVAVRDALSVAARAAANDVARAALRDALSVAARAAARAALRDAVRDAVRDAAWAAASDALRAAAVSVAVRDAVSVAAWAATSDARDAAIYAAGVAARAAQAAWLRANTKPNFSKPEVKNDLP